MSIYLRITSMIFLSSFASFAVLGQVSPRYSSSEARPFPGTKVSRLVLQLEHENGGVITGNERARESLAEAYYNAFNLKIGWQSQPGDNLYNQLYNYPIYGIGLYSSTFGLAHVGNPYALYGFVSIPIKSREDKRWNFNYRIALGLSGRFNPYDENRNPFNQLIGTSNNVFIDLGGQVNYRLSKRIQAGVGLAFHHFSNGALQMPNTGINLLPFTAAITYIPRGDLFEFKEEGTLPEIKRHELHLNYAFGFKQLDRDNPNKYFKSTLGAYYSKHFGYKWRMGLGADVFYSGSGNDVLVTGEDQVGKFSSLFSTGLTYYIDHVLTSRLYLSGNVGYYLHRNEFNQEHMPFYLRIGVRYRTYKRFYNGISIKAHGGRADFIEWTTGYSFNLGKRNR